MKGKFIYKIRNVVNGKFYVGSTTNTRERFRTHRNRLRRNRHHAPHLQAAWNKYGEDCFKFEVVEDLADDVNLQGAEDRWLAKHVGQEYCYNKSRYSDSPMRGIPKEQHPSFGRPKSKQARDQISATLKAFYAEDVTNHPRFGKQHTEETKAKISAARKGKMVGETHYRYGRTLSEEVRRKIGDTQRGKRKPSRTYTPEGLAKVRDNMRKVAAEHPQLPKAWGTVFAKFPVEVQQRYDFSNAVYTGALVRITGVRCPHHGEFSQYSAQFRKGRGCPACGGEVRATKKKQEMLEKWQDPMFRETIIQKQNEGKKGTKSNQLVDSLPD